MKKLRLNKETLRIMDRPSDLGVVLGASEGGGSDTCYRSWTCYTVPPTNDGASGYSKCFCPNLVD
jgi:hypothetical protein